MSTRLTQKKLHQLFLQDISGYSTDVEDTGRKPMTFSLTYPFNRDVKAYIFNCTAPPGGRTIDEFKIQLILDGQKRGNRGSFDTSDGKTTLIAGYAVPFLDEENGIWVLFELDKHKEFAYSANIQVYLRQLLCALEEDVYVCEKCNHETLIIARRKNLAEALKTRFATDREIMLERAEHGITEL